MPSKEPLLYTPPQVEICGKRYSLRRLGILDIQRLVEIIVDFGMETNVTRDDLNAMSIEDWVGKLINLIPFALDKILDFERSILVDFSLTVEEMKDPERFPLGSETKILNALLDHEDAQDFFAQAQKLIKHPQMLKLTGKARSRGKSKRSKKKRAGATSKS